jgi:isopentenyl-diphosphate delta-isomerase
MDELHGSFSAAARDDSVDLDALILVDEADREVGHLSKALCHEGRGVLHRAFSLLIFNARGELLLQQRAASKRLWPLYWSNSCCSHPRRAETMEAAIKRRLQYQAQFDATAAEHELCSVFIARCTDHVRINPDEILGWRWISPEALQAAMSGRGAEKFTPWFILEWARIWRDHRAAVSALNSEPSRP